MCERKKCELGEKTEKFSEWVSTHKSDCQHNYEGSSPAMEMIAAEKIWQRSQDFGFRYTTLVSDGDRKTLVHLNLKKVYGEKEIEKVECLNLSLIHI